MRRIKRKEGSDRENNSEYVKYKISRIRTCISLHLPDALKKLLHHLRANTPKHKYEADIAKKHKYKEGILKDSR